MYTTITQYFFLLNYMCHMYSSSLFSCYCRLHRSGSETHDVIARASDVTSDHPTLFLSFPLDGFTGSTGGAAYSSQTNLAVSKRTSHTVMIGCWGQAHNKHAHAVSLIQWYKIFIYTRYHKLY